MTTRLHRQLASIAVDIAYLGSCITEVEAELATKIVDLQGVAYDGSGIRSGISDPTARAALAPSGARHDLDRLHDAIRRAEAAIRDAAAIATNHRTQDPATLRRNLRRLIADGEPGCELHARVGVWVPVYRSGTVAGRLREKTALCRACYDFIGTNDRAPSKKELNAEKRTGKLRPVDAPTSGTPARI